MQPSAGVGQHSDPMISEAAKPEGGGMFRSGWSSDMSPYAKRDSVFRREGSESPIVKRGSQSRTTGAEGHPVCTSEALRARKIGEEAA
jgi:hypothetical protein